jgi:hypothetical protein
MGPARLVSARVAQAPTLDGVGDDEVWKAAVPLQVIARRPLPPHEGASVPVTIRSVHTDSQIFFLVAWDDSTESVSHKTWVWNADKQTYNQADDREDMFALAFEHTGPFDADMLAGTEAVWDVWHWKAFRTNPQGYATDKTHHYTLSKPQRKAKSHTARNKKEIWIARPEDSGDSVEGKRPAPTTFGSERVAQYVPATPSGSAADVRAKGVWSSGEWTLELSRHLDTENPDDTALDPQRSYKIAVAPFDNTGEMDTASGVIELALVRLAASKNFESDEQGAVPSGFSTARTGRGDPGEWVVREETNPPSGQKVVAQISDDSTNYRLPLLVYDDLKATDVDVSVRFKTVSGRVDQAAGIVWRYQDVDNYYVVRANALEDNVVAYKVENGKRSNIGVKGAGSSYGVKTEISSGQWNSLRVVADGSLFEIYSNDRKLFETEDAAFSTPGRIGLWTKADSVTYFDDLVAFSLPSSNGDPR